VVPPFTFIISLLFFVVLALWLLYVLLKFYKYEEVYPEEVRKEAEKVEKEKERKASCQT